MTWRAETPPRGFLRKFRNHFGHKRGLVTRGWTHLARPASPLRYLADAFLAIIQAFYLIEKDAQAFLDHLTETNSTRVQSDVMDRVQESRGLLEVEIRKLLHEVSRIAERALDHARVAKAEGAAVVEAKLARLKEVDEEIRAFLGSFGAPE